MLLVCVAGWPLVGCPSDPPPECITVDAACAPLYQPTFTNVYNNTLVAGCGSTMSSCHSASGLAGGVSFEDQQTAYDHLMLSGRVKPGNAACSEMIVRTSSPGEDYQMPPGDPLMAAEQCALIQWVQNGAMP
jgi:hypothetical protein